MSLVADYSSSSENDNTEDDTVPQISEAKEKPKLPSANLLLSNSATGKTGEVFSNPYKQAEQAKIALLERHVKMVNSDEYLKEKNGKKICWNYRKGRCRFSSNCTFAHDSDLNQSADNNNHIEIPTNATKQESTPPVAEAKHLNTSTNPQTPRPAKKRSRPGLSDTVTPSKKVLKAYANQKQRNHPSQTNKFT